MTEKTASQKLLIKGSHSVLLLTPPPDYESILGKIPGSTVWIDRKSEKPDVIVAFLENRKALETRLLQLKSLMKPKSLLWLCYYKGTSKIKTDINRDTINSFCIENGLRGIAMISINDDWSALRLKPIE
jgi:hypothetical protein